MPRRIRKQYKFAGLAGCVVQNVSKKTGTLTGLYASDQAGMESDPELPWSTVCEVHNTLVSHHGLAEARRTLPDPTNWCDECRAQAKTKVRHFVIQTGRASPTEYLDAAEEHGEVIQAKLHPCQRGIDVYGIVELKRKPG